MIAIEVVAACLSAIAAVAAAVAAWKSYSTAQKALEFEKRYAKNQYSLVQANVVLGKLLKLRGLLSNVLEAPDDEVRGAEALYRECQADLQMFAASTTCTTGDREILTLNDALPPFAESADHIADVIRAIASVQTHVAQILH